MSRTATMRKYGKQARKPRAELLFAENQPQPVTDFRDESTRESTPVPPQHGRGGEIASILSDELVFDLADAFSKIELKPTLDDTSDLSRGYDEQEQEHEHEHEHEQEHEQEHEHEQLRILTWADVCPPGDMIEKIAEASYAEVYRVTNARGVSIIKVIRLQSPLKPQTKAQERSGLVDEEPHLEEDLHGELKISEWLADIPGFVVYKERYIVKGKAPKALLETHQTFHRKVKRKDPDRLQFYPSPGRYLDDTRFLVVELGDAGTALEDFALVSATQLWDIFLHVAIALARAEDQIKFEHRDLHEGNLCIRETRTPQIPDSSSAIRFGYSGLDITILDYGLSRAEDVDSATRPAIAFDLEKDLSLFTSTHAPQCKVYRQMRSFLLKGDRLHLPPSYHVSAYETGKEGTSISWTEHHPYTNVLWLAYIYHHLTSNFQGDKKELARFKRTSKELWAHLNPNAPVEILSFSSAVDVVRFTVEAGWLSEAQLMGYREGWGGSESVNESCNESIIEVQITERDETELRRSPRRRNVRVVY